MDAEPFDLAQATEAPPAIVVPAAPEGPPKWALVPEKKSHAVRDREIVFQVLNAIDAVQTVTWCDRFPKNVKCEANPLFGDHPSTGKIVGIKVVNGLLHYLITKRLEKRNPKYVEFWQVSTIVIQGGVVALNLRTAF
jgi:hypothetical protein